MKTGSWDRAVTALVAAVFALGLMSQAEARGERGGGARGGGGGGDGGFSRGGAASSGGLSSGGTTAAQGGSRAGGGQQGTAQQRQASRQGMHLNFNFKCESECAPEFGELHAGNLRPEPGEPTAEHEREPGPAPGYVEPEPERTTDRGGSNDQPKPEYASIHREGDAKHACYERDQRAEQLLGRLQRLQLGLGRRFCGGRICGRCNGGRCGRCRNHTATRNHHRRRCACACRAAVQRRPHRR